MDGDSVYRGVGRTFLFAFLLTVGIEVDALGGGLVDEYWALPPVASFQTGSVGEGEVVPPPRVDYFVRPATNLEGTDGDVVQPNRGLESSDPSLPTPSASPSDQSKKIGEAPPPTNMAFLRKQSVLLKPCEWQFDVGFSYMYHEDELSLTLPPTTIVRSRIRQRIISMPMEFRYGLRERIQLFVNMPVGWANTEYSQFGSDDFFNNTGIGDTNAGATFHVFKSDGMSYSPDVVATFGLTAPTGDGNALFGLFESPETTLGQGYWAGFWNVLFIHQYDPVTVFYGFGGRHYVSRELGSFTAKPGDQFTYQLGTGFAVNERITLSTAFFGSFITEARIDNEVIPGTIQEPMYLRFAATISRPQRICEPFVELGMTNAAANSRVGITWTF